MLKTIQRIGAPSRGRLLILPGSHTLAGLGAKAPVQRAGVYPASRNAIAWGCWGASTHATAQGRTAIF